MLRPCLICDDGYSPHFRELDGCNLYDFPSLPELAVALFKNETTQALEMLTENYQIVEAKQDDNAWDKFSAMSSRDAVDYLIDLLLKVASTFDWLFRDNQLYQQNARSAIGQIVCHFPIQVQELDDQFGVRYSKSESCPIWLLEKSPVRHLHAATDYAMKWSDGSYIIVTSGETYPSLRDCTIHRPDGLMVKVHNHGASVAEDTAVADEILKHLDYSTPGRSLNQVYNPPVLESFTGALAEWVKYNTTLGDDFWHEQIEIYQQAFLPVLDELIKADEQLRQAEKIPVLVERLGKAKLGYVFARLKAEVLLESYQAYFHQVEQDTCHIINGYDYYPRFIGDNLHYDGYHSGGDTQVPSTQHDDRPFCQYLDEFDRHVLFSKAQNPAPGIFYDVCFGFTADHSGFQLTLSDDRKRIDYTPYNWSKSDDFSNCDGERACIFKALFVSEFSPYMAKDCLPAGLQAKLDEFKDFGL